MRAAQVPLGDGVVHCVVVFYTRTQADNEPPRGKGAWKSRSPAPRGRSTGSCHIVHVNGKHIRSIADSSRPRHETQAKKLRLPIDVSRIDAVVLSHAHIACRPHPVLCVRGIGDGVVHGGGRVTWQW